jgi:hypothetical protein
MATQIETPYQAKQQAKTARNLLKPRPAARYIMKSAGTLATWRCLGEPELPYYKINGVIYYDQADLDAFLDGSRVVPGEPPPAKPRKRGRPRKAASTSAAA